MQKIYGEQEDENHQVNNEQIHHMKIVIDEHKKNA